MELLYVLAALLIAWFVYRGRKAASRRGAPSVSENGERVFTNRTAFGSVDGRHFTEHVAAAKAMVRRGDLDEAAGLLLRLIDALEAEAQGGGAPVLAPWYYEQLAKVYRKTKDPAAEAALLRRYVFACAKVGDTPSAHMMSRLEAAQTLDVKAARTRLGRID